MVQRNLLRENIGKIALVGNYIPRRCGIATFTHDLLTALIDEGETESFAVVMNDIPGGYPYPAQVRFALDQKNVADYRMAADFLNMSQVEIVCLQHEYGIYGGDDGAYILELINNLRMPVVTTLHTVLTHPTFNQATILKRIAQASDRIVVMSFRAVEILRALYEIPKEKIVVIHHGIPDVPFVDPNYYKDQFGVEGRKVILTFGLLSPGKGIETMIEALPLVVRKNPDVVYIVLGATHPNIKREQGEAYRLSLQRKARELGVDDHIIFHNRFVELSELCEFLGAADLYVTPYLNREQIVSGTLAYALGTGKATVSTPYLYAEEMLGEDRGKLVPFRNPEALAAAINDLLEHEVERHAMRKRAYSFCRKMVWKEVAREYIELFLEVKRERLSKPRTVFHAKTMDHQPREIPQLKLDHLIRLTDDVGIIQHAKFIVPDRYHGYCTDDNARALIAVLMAQEILAETQELMNLACIYISFLHHAFNENTGRFRNFMGYDRRWLEEVGSEDSHGRAVWGLGEAIALSKSEHLTGAALPIFQKALPVLVDFTSPRAWAFGIIGINAYLKKFGGDTEVQRIMAKLVDNLFALYEKNASPDWPWPEENLTYANARIPQALIIGGQRQQNETILQAGIESLTWLVNLQTDPKGYFVPIGNHGWHKKNGTRARFDQQPVEALSMISACRESYNVTGDGKWILQAQRCLDWFLGFNDLNTPLYDYTTGGCCDGLTANGPNRNQGAESTLSWLLSLLNVYSLRNDQVSITFRNNKSERL